MLDPAEHSITINQIQIKQSISSSVLAVKEGRPCLNKIFGVPKAIWHAERCVLLELKVMKQYNNRA